MIDLRLLTNGDVIVVVDHNQVAQLLMTGNTGRLASNALLCASIAHKAVGVVVEKLEPRPVEVGLEM